MNLLIDAHVFDGAHQGSRTYLKGIYGELIKMRPDIQFFFAAYDPAKLQTEFGEYAHVHYLGLKKTKALRLLVEFPQLVKRHKIDYAHFQYISPPIRNCKQIVTTHDILFQDFKDYFPVQYRVVKNFLFKISARQADVLLTVSQYSKQRIASHYHIPLRDIVVTPNGVPDDFVNEVSLPDFGTIKTQRGINKYILYVSRVEPRKNHLILLKAFQELSLWEKGFKLVFIGKRDFSYHILDEFIKQGPPELASHLISLQNVENDELKAWYANADLFVYPSVAEGFGIPPIESVASGTPTLCSNTTAMTEFSFLGDDLFDPTNLEELKQKILNRLDHALPEAVRMQRKAYVIKKYSWYESAKALSNVI